MRWNVNLYNSVLYYKNNNNSGESCDIYTKRPDNEILRDELGNPKCDQLCRSTNQEVVDFCDDVWEETFDGKGPLAFIEVWLSDFVAAAIFYQRWWQC